MPTQYIELPIAEPHEKSVLLSSERTEGLIFTLNNATAVINDCLVTIDGELGKLEINTDTNEQAVQLCLQLANDFGITYREEI